MAYTIRQNGASLQVFNAMTGAPLFTISGIGSIKNWNISGSTLSIYNNTGGVQVWDLARRSKIR